MPILIHLTQMEAFSYKRIQVYLLCAKTFVATENFLFISATGEIKADFPQMLALLLNLVIKKGF